MIYLKKMDNREFILNVDLIETIAETPDTVITLTNGNKILVTETAEEIIEKIIQYKRKIYINDIDVEKLYK